MKLQFKNNVYGFVYDSTYGEITEVLTKPVTETEARFFNDHSGDVVMFTDIDSITEIWDLNDGEHDPEYIKEYWGDILEVVQ